MNLRASEEKPHESTWRSRQTALEQFENWVLDEPFIENVLALSAHVDYVSFDIFDTAVTRIVDSPADVYALAEETLRRELGDTARGYALARESAEIEARRLAWNEGREEIDVDEIYAVLARDARFKSWADYAKNVEQNTELEVCLATPDIAELIRRLQAAGRKIIFVSDMYQTSAFIERLLTHCGYTAWSALYVSSATGCTKYRGTQWPHVLDDLGQGVRLLHIGDDEQSDVAIPPRYGLKSLAFERVRSERRVGADLTPDVSVSSRLRRGCFLAMAACGQETDDAWWRRLGVTLGGPILFSYIHWLAQRATALRIRHLYFCARDGSLIKSAWEAAGLGEKTGITRSYLYVSRRPLNLAFAYAESTPHKLAAFLTDLYTTGWDNLTLQDAIDRVATLDPESLSADAKRTFGALSHPLDWRNAEAFKNMLQRHARDIHAALGKNHEATIAYLRQEGLFQQSRAALVDLGWAGTMQASVNSLLKQAQAPTELTGFYYGLQPNASGNRYLGGWMESAFGSEFVELERQPHLRNGIDILENLHTADHGSVASYQRTDKGWQPVFQTNEAESAQFRRVVAPFQAGLLDAVRIWSSGGETCGVRAEEITLRAAISALAAIVCSPSGKELRMLGSIVHCPTFEHQKFAPLISQPPAADIAVMEERLRSAGWPIGMLKYWYTLPGMPPPSQLRDMALRVLPDLGNRRLRQFQ